jgi:hypothetical protein
MAPDRLGARRPLNLRVAGFPGLLPTRQPRSDLPGNRLSFGTSEARPDTPALAQRQKSRTPVRLRALSMSRDIAVAERVGFEPTVTCATHDFQSCRIGRSRTPPATATRFGQGTDTMPLTRPDGGVPETVPSSVPFDPLHSDVGPARCSVW